MGMGEPKKDERYVTQEEAERRLSIRLNALPPSLQNALGSAGVHISFDMAEACAVLRCGRSCLMGMAREGRVKSYRAGRFWRFPVESILAYRDGKPQPK